METQIKFNSTKLGSNTGDHVNLRSGLAQKYNDCFGIITGWRPARNYNQDAVYAVDIIKDGEVIDSVFTDWGNITDKNI